MITLTHEEWLGGDCCGWINVPCKSKKDVDVSPKDIEDFKAVKFTIAEKTYKQEFDENGVQTTQVTEFSYSITSTSRKAIDLFAEFVEQLSNNDIKDILLPIRATIEALIPKLLDGICLTTAFDWRGETETISVSYPIPFLTLQANEFLLCSNVIGLVFHKMIELYEALPD